MARNTKTHNKLQAGQQITEYIILVGFVAAAILTMQLYMKRGMASGLSTASRIILGEENIDTSGNSISDSNSDTTRTVTQTSDSPGHIDTTIDEISHSESRSSIN